MAEKWRESSLEDLNLTRDEVERIGAALKKEEFRKLLLEYAEEINDPENKKLYEKEITELEKERGVEVTFVNPEPCYVIKSSVNGSKKAFINICKNDKVGKPISEPITKSGNRGLNWALPYTQAPPRDDLDKNGNRCLVFDVVFNPDTHHLAENNVQFKKMLNNTALDAVEDNFNVQLDRKNIKFPKMKYKGTPRPTVIRKKMENPPETSDEFSIPDSFYPYKPPVDQAEIQAKCDEAKKLREENERENINKPKMPYTTPKYIIKHRHSVDIQDFSNDRDSKVNAATPKELVIEVQLPLLNSSADIILDVTEKSITLVSEKPAMYKLELSLPYSVNEEGGSAKFDKSLRKLVITLPVRKHSSIHMIDVGREDSGVESDLGRRTPESSTDEEDYASNQNSVIEVQRNEVFIPDIAGDEAYRTINTVQNKFLKRGVHYILPAFTCNVVNNIVAFTLHVKNVDPDSIAHTLFGENMNGLHIEFESIGSGFFPIYYAFCLKFPSSASIDLDSLNAEAWDNNVIVQMQLNPCDISVVEYYAGLEEESAVKFHLPEPAAISRKLEQLKIDTLESNMKTDIHVEVTKCTESELTVEVIPQNSETALDEDDDDDDDDEPIASICNINSTDINENVQIDTPKMTQKSRTLSESSGDELGFSPTKKGILKNNGRVCRSLSESSVDDYAWSSSLDLVTQSGSESCIPEETAEDEREIKKTVRFNEVVSQKTYRTNSSILGQRKKNQRKTRNKRRSQERRASESENSEGEVEREKERERKSEEGKEKELENEMQGDVIPTVQESQDHVDINDHSLEAQMKNDKQPGVGGKSSPKGKRKNRKGAGTSQSEVSADTQVEFGSDLIFDLDM